MAEQEELWVNVPENFFEAVTWGETKARVVGGGV